MTNHFPIPPSSITPEHGHGHGGVNGNGATTSSGAVGPRGASSWSDRGGESGSLPPSVRVILVGRTGQDAALRLDQSIELLRAHQPLGAVGELASPMDDSSPKPATVIVGAEAVPAGRAREFVSALRRVDPTVRVLAISNENRPEFDGTIPPAITADAIRRLVHSIHGPVNEPALGLDEEDALAVGLRTAEDDVLEVLMGGRGTGESSEVEARDRGGERPTLGLVEDRGEEETERTAEGAGRSASDDREPERADETAPGRVEEVAPSGAAGLAFAESAVLEALLSGVEAHAATLDAVRRASGLAELELIVHDELAEPGEAQGSPEGPHIKLVHAGLVMGYLRLAGGSSSAGVQLASVSPELVQWASVCLALARKHRQLGEYAFTDELTGAFNRRFFNQFMAEALNRAKAQRQFLTLLYFDIDDFKLYNDRFGHDAGDDILLQTVSLLKSVIRPSDKVCRLGGDEFAVIFYDPAAGIGRSAGATEAPLTDARMGGAPQSIAEIAKRFQKQICEHRYPKLAEHAPGTLTISGGMATFPWDGLTADELLRRADELLLQSKAQGKNLITFGPGAQQICEMSGE